MTPEFSCPERLDAIGAGERSIEIAADADERAALARRFGLVAIDALAATLVVRHEAAGIAVTGRVTAQVTQACTVTGDPVAATIDEAVALRFVAPSESAEEVELGADAIDTVELDGNALDLGEVAAETLALALDPYPRSPAAAAALKDAGVLGEDEAGPFAALAALKDKLSG